MSYSLDLKKRVLDFIEEGHSKVEASKLFHVSKRAIFLWIKEKKEQGEIKLKLRDRKPYKIDDEKLMVYLQKNPDHYLKEIAVSFHVSISGIFYALRRLKMTYKKKRFSTSSGMKKNAKNSLKRSKAYPLKILFSLMNQALIGMFAGIMVALK